MKRRAYHAAYYWRTVERRRERAREHSRLGHLRQRLDRGKHVPLHRLWPGAIVLTRCMPRV
jgi:hypothetical protein